MTIEFFEKYRYKLKTFQELLEIAGAFPRKEKIILNQFIMMENQKYYGLGDIFIRLIFKKNKNTRNRKMIFVNKNILGLLV